jgi:hypothetical protein
MGPASPARSPRFFAGVADLWPGLQVTLHLSPKTGYSVWQMSYLEYQSICHIIYSGAKRVYRGINLHCDIHCRFSVICRKTSKKSCELHRFVMSKCLEKTSIGGPKEGFQATQWSEIFNAKTADDVRRRAIIDTLLRKYWKPVYCYIRRKRYDNEQAKDLTTLPAARSKLRVSRLDLIRDVPS